MKSIFIKSNDSIKKSQDEIAKSKMAEPNNWIASGDRSSPQLKLIDELRNEVTYEGHGDDLEKLEETHLSGRDCAFDDLLFRVRESLRIHDGDRSHPRLVHLDALLGRLTYEGWEDDFDDALNQHLTYEHDSLPCFKNSMEKMKRRQCIFVDDYSHENVRFLGSLDLSFPGWEQEVQHAMELHMDGFSIDYYRFSLPERQRMFEGTRSHRRLVALDNLRLTYPNWEEDAKEAERKHIEDKIGYADDDFGMYESYLELLSSKQRAYETGGNAPWLHPIQRQILDTNWTYSGHGADMETIQAAESAGYSSSSTFEVWLEKCTLKQLIHDGNIHEHQSLVKLYELQLSYPQWEDDFEAAKGCLLNYGPTTMFLFDNLIEGMKSKQAVYEGTEEAKKSARQVPTSQQAARGQNNGTCVICFEARRTHIFVPCGHACVCKSCSDRVMTGNRKCPICNKFSTLTTEFFLP